MNPEILENTEKSDIRKEEIRVALQKWQWEATRGWFSLRFTRCHPTQY